jgi:predicted dehydrogenase
MAGNAHAGYLIIMSQPLFRWAIVGPGRIAHRFAEAIAGIENTRVVCVQGRALARAQAFADKWSVNADANQPGNRIRATTNLDDVFAADIDAVYIATPHAFHADVIRACLIAKKPVLCEKSMVTDAATARELSALAHAQNTFLMEAVWTRFLPIYATIGEWLRAGEIGTMRAMQSSFCFHAPWDPTSRVYDPAQAGGALLDIGVYNLTVTRWALAAVYGACPPVEEIQIRAKLGVTGVDHSLTATLHFAGGVHSQFYCSVEGASENAFRIYGEHGSITIEPYFWAATKATLSRTGKAPLTIEKPWRINGFEGEIEETMRCVRTGKVQSSVMPLQETCDTLEWMDRIRAQIGVRYPFDRVL